MSGPILCTGRYALKPYYLEKIGRRIYSIEELCYCITQNAFLIDSDSFEMSLVDWISDELLLQKLSDELRSMLVHNCSAAALAGLILEYVGYSSKEEISSVEEILKNNADMDIYEKRMSRADFLMKQGHLHQAFAEYGYLQKHSGIVLILNKQIINYHGRQFFDDGLFSFAAVMEHSVVAYCFYCCEYEIYGSFESYMEKGLNITAEEIDSFKNYILE